MDARENILLIRLKSIGDIVFTLPAVHAVRENFPDARLHFLVSKEHAELLRGFPDIDEIVPLDRSMYHSGNPIRLCSNFFKLVHDLRKKNFSHVMDFQGYGETAWLSWLSGAPERWGSVYQAVRTWAYTCGVQRNREVHPAEWNLSLLQQCGLKIANVRNQFVLSDEPLAEAKRFFAANNLDASRPTIYLQPFTSNPKKNWPLENYLALAKHFHSRGAQIIFGGGPGERQKLKSACAADFAVAAGAPLLVSASLMKLSTLILGGDTGFLHLAVAMGKRVVMLMQSTAPGKPHPFHHADWSLTPPPGKIVADIPVSDAIGAVENFCLNPAKIKL